MTSPLRAREADLAELLARVEKASGPDRELDGSIALFCGWTHEVNHAEDYECWRNPDGKAWYLPRYTASIDAALALVEQKRPGWFWRAGHVPSFHWHKGANYDNWCHLSRTDASNCERDDEATGWANSVPLAILTALLSALLSQETQDDHKL